MSTDEAYTRGWDTLLRINRGREPAVVAEVERFSPDVARMIVAFGYGEIYARPGLEPQQRQLITIALLTALGDCHPQLDTHVAAALNVGVPPEQIIEAVIHSLPFVGFPRALNALSVIRTVFERRGIEPAHAQA